MAELSKYEQETIINYNEAEPTASVYTHNKKLMHQLEGISLSRNDCSLEKSGATYAEYIVPKKWIKVRPPRRLSEEQKALVLQRLKK